MPLEKTTVSIALSQGLDTKTDPKQVVAGKLEVLENAMFQTPQEIIKTPGYNEIGTSIANGNGIVQYNEELVAEDGFSVYSFSESQNTFNSKGNKLAVDLTVQSIIKNTFQQTVPDSAYAANLQVFVWEDTQGGVRYCVIDYQTGLLIKPDTLILATGIKPKVKFINSTFVIMYGDTASTNLRYVSIDVSTPTVLSAPVVLATNLSASHPNFDACLNGTTKLFVAYNTGSDIRLFYLDVALVRSSITTVAGNDANNCLTIFNDRTLNQLWIAFQNTAFGVKYFVVDVNLATILSTTAIETTTEARNITGTADNGTGRIFYEITAASSDNAFIRTANLTNGGGVSGVADFIRSVGLASKAFFVGTITYVLIAHDSPLQPTYFLYNCVLKTVVTKIAPSNGGGLTDKASDLPEVNIVSGGLYQVAYLFKDLLVAVNGNVFTQTGINSALITLSLPIVNQVLGNDLHMSGGILTMYDGANVVEHGFNIYPEDIVQEIIPAAATGGLTTGSYQYQAVYEWTDNQGQIHKSSPSVALTSKVETFDIYNFAADTTSGSFFINNVPSSVTALAYVGMSVVGGTLPANTVVTSVSTFILGISNDPASTAHSTFTLIPTLQWYGQPFVGSNLVIFVQRPTFLPYYGSSVSGSNVLTIPDPSRLKVGQTLISSFSLAAAAITAINGTQVTVSKNATATGNFLFSKFIQFFCVSSTVSNVLTGVTATSPGVDTDVFDSFVIGQPLFPIGTDPRTVTTFITGFDKSLRTVTMSANWVSSGFAQVNCSPDLNDFLSVGEVITGEINASFPAPTLITAIDNAGGKVTLSNPATSVVLDSFGYSTFTMGPQFSNILSIPTLRVTDKQSVSIVLYRTEVNGTIFYRITSPQNLLYNDTTTDFVTYVDNAFDANIIGNEQIYTTGGEVANIAAPAALALITYKNRMILIPEENTMSFWYSKQVIPGQPVEFSDEFVQNVDSKGGDITVPTVMDDKLILFKSNLIFYVAGDGPTPAGTNNTFTDSILIASDTGCINKKSVVSTPVGVIYQSQNGIYLLDRSLQVSYIGAPVADFNSSTITSALLIPGFTQIRFTLDSGDILIFDYFMNQWSVRTNNQAIDACIYKQVHTYISIGGVINQETPSTYTDNANLIPISLTTSWLSFANLQGYQRVYKLMLLGEYISPHTLTVQLAYDFDPTIAQTVTIPILSDPGVYQFRVFLARQKCEAVRITITESQDPVYGQGLSLSNMAFEVGKKRDLDKLPAAKSYG